MTAVAHSEFSAAQSVTTAAGSPLVGAARKYADDVLRPSALRTDRDGVARERIDELADLGLLNHVAPAEFGGGALGRGDDRLLHEIIAGACFNTWLVWAQHAPMVDKLVDAHKAGQSLPAIGYEVLRGRVLVGAAISDVRHYPHRYIRAVRTGDGWTFSGTVSGVSGWGLNTVLTVAAVDDATDTVVTALVPVSERFRTVPLELSALGGSRTERVDIDDVFVPDSDVVKTQPLADWRTEDIGVAGDARPHHFGLAYTVLDELERADHPGAQHIARVWRPRVDQIRYDAYELADEVKETKDKRHRIDERLAGKVAIGEALGTLTRALVAARSGRGLALDDTAQLHARSALFVLVQGQSADVRDAQLAHFAR